MAFPKAWLSMVVFFNGPQATSSLREAIRQLVLRPLKEKGVRGKQVGSTSRSPVVGTGAWRQQPREREQNQSKGPAQVQGRHKRPGMRALQVEDPDLRGRTCGDWPQEGSRAPVECGAGTQKQRVKRERDGQEAE